MKRSIRHLPAKKQYELNKILSYITANRPVEMVILFGSYAHGNWVEDKYTEDGITYEYKSDYDLWVVVENEKRHNCTSPPNASKRKSRNT
ncbi:MAG: nucleotidyltransferase domain-containing protein [Bacteroidales bacterium]|nr:nucleotidyltransferase domain-containing protein [Bacteroidales bacterium]MCF8387962.1 nucleotidyltransferase domain-containing protein [Bacteroidales bacterium]MCF8399607.1 nucleotidyltransferase domain-containing protein [Bacteroidales bacterium]